MVVQEINPSNKSHLSLWEREKSRERRGRGCPFVDHKTAHEYTRMNANKYTVIPAKAGIQWRKAPFINAALPNFNLARCAALDPVFQRGDHESGK
jgi:hypothetical protein